MIISGLKYFEYNIPFSEPLKTASGNITGRNGAVVQLSDDADNTAYGEIAPLEIAGMTGIRDCINQIEQIRNMPDWGSDIGSLIRKKNFAPEVKFGIEQALHSLKLVRNSKHVSGNSNKTIPVNALLGLDDEKILLKKAGRLIDEGYHTIKIKISNINLDRNIELLKRMQAKFGADLKIRLDANGCLDFNEASEVLSVLNPDFIEYIEDPVNDADDIIALQEKSAVKIALDEMVTPLNVIDLLDIPPIKYYVIKPVKFGFYGTMEIINEAESKNKSVIISSMFESAVGRSALVYLASFVKGGHAHGLDTGRFLSNDLAESIYPCDKPTVEFKIKDYPPLFDFGGMFK